MPIFRWHAVGPYPAGDPFPEPWVEPADFERQMDRLAGHGSGAVGLETVERAWSGDGRLLAKPVVLSFDGAAREAAAEAEDAAAAARRGLEAKLGVPIANFAVPHDSTSPRATPRAAEAAGNAGARATSDSHRGCPS